jgi:outer membrane protein assembly factor BamB
VPLRRRAAQADRHTFELVDDGFADDPDLDPVLDQGAGSGSGPEDGRDEDRHEGGRRRRRLVVGASAAVLVAVLAGMTAVDAAQSRADLARLREAPGGVAPMLTAPQEVWSVDDVVPGAFELVPGAVVTVQGGDVVAHDLATGEERWRTGVGGAVSCGAVLGFSYAPGVAPSDELVCLVDPADQLMAPGGVTSPTPAVASSVVVLGADGELLGRRALDAADGAAMPGPDGSLVRVLRVGEVPAEHGSELEADPSTGEPESVPPGRDAVVVLEDALTGEERWRHDLPFTEGLGWNCVGWVDDDGGASRMLADLERLWGVVVGDLVQVDGCGVSAWFGEDGARLDDPASPADGVLRLPDGALYRDATGQMGWGYVGAVPTEERSVVLAADGSVRWEAPGPLFLPKASDGRDLGLRLLRTEGVLAAYGDDGAQRWSSAGAEVPEEVLAVAGGVVVTSRDGVLAALDAGTGLERWSVESEVLRDTGATDAAGGFSFPAAFTDGEHVVVLTQDWSGRDQQLVAVDLADGDVAWRTDVGANAWPLAAQGALLVVGEGSVTRLG